MANLINKAAVTAALFVLSGTAFGQKVSKTGPDGVPHMKPPTAKEIKAVVAARGTNSWNFRMQKDGSMVSDIEEVSDHNGFQIHSYSNDSVVVERVDPTATRNMEAQIVGETPIDAQTLNTANWQIIVNEQQKAKTAWLQQHPRPPSVGSPGPAPTL